MFTDVIRNYVQHGARLILVPNGDPDAPNHLFEKVHAAITAFRAAENGVPVVMADIFQISTIFDSDGRVVAQTAPGRVDAICAQVHPTKGRTVYNGIGDILAYLCIACVLAVLAQSWRSGKTESKG
jgi:apolipoprotein N-acyltransferase